jgi:hypothetical protein
MKFANLILLIGLLMVCAGCNAPAAQVNTPTAQLTATAPSVLPSPTVAPSALPGLTLDRLNSGSYMVPIYNRVIHLVDGKFEGGSGADYLMAMLLQDKAAFGDLNQDGQPDAAVFLAENGGGSGVFVSLMVVYNQSGQVAQGGTVPIDDRPRITAVSIRSGQVWVEATIHGPGDVMAAPTLGVVEVFQPSGEQLNLVKLSSKTPSGGERSITIESPVSGSEVTHRVRVVGKMPIAPFENTLTYRVYDQAGKQLVVGSLAVSAQEPGGPAVIDQTLDLSAIPAGPMRLELAEMSAANGTKLALDSLTLVVK